MHVKGQLLHAQLHNAAAALSPLSTGLVYWNTTSGRGYVYNSTAWERILSTADESITMDHITTPATPAAGKIKVYFKSDNNLYKLDSSGSEVLIPGATTPGLLVDRDSDADVTVADNTTLLHPRLKIQVGDDYIVSSGGGLECNTSFFVNVGATLFVAMGGYARVV